MRYANWKSGESGEESALWMGEGPTRLLIVPALFDEGNRMRRLTVEVMRRLAASGIASVLPDLPGLQESTFPLERADLDHWRGGLAGLAMATGARRVLALRGGALISPDGLAGWHYAPTPGTSILRQMIRARIIAAREAGREEKHDALLALGRAEGLDLAGYRLGPAMIADLESAQAPHDDITLIGHEMLGGSPLWLRAEPGENHEQADALAAIIAVGMRSEGLA